MLFCGLLVLRHSGITKTVTIWNTLCHNVLSASTFEWGPHRMAKTHLMRDNVQCPGLRGTECRTSGSEALVVASNCLQRYSRDTSVAVKTVW